MLVVGEEALLPVSFSACNPAYPFAVSTPMCGVAAYSLRRLSAFAPTTAFSLCFFRYDRFSHSIPWSLSNCDTLTSLTLVMIWAPASSHYPALYRCFDNTCQTTNKNNNGDSVVFIHENHSYFSSYLSTTHSHRQVLLDTSPLLTTPSVCPTSLHCR